MEYMECVYSDNNRTAYKNPETMDRLEVDYVDCGENFIVFEVSDRIFKELGDISVFVYLNGKAYKCKRRTHCKCDNSMIKRAKNEELIGVDFEGYNIYISDQGCIEDIYKYIPNLDEIMNEIRVNILLK